MIGALRFLKSIPTTVYAAVVLTAAFSGAYAYHLSAVDRADKNGYRRAIDGARFDSTLLALVDTARAKAAHKTDTVIRVVTQHVERVRTIEVHDTVRVAFPVVDTLVVESLALASAVDSLVVSITAERAATKASLDVRDVAIRDARLELARSQAQVLTLSKRPTRRDALLYSLASALGGAGLSYAVSR